MPENLFEKNDAGALKGREIVAGGKRAASDTPGLCV